MVTTNPEMLCTLCFFILLEPRKYKKIRLTGLSYVTWWLCLSDTILCLYSPLCFASLLLAQKHQTIIQLFLTSSSVNLNCSVKQKKNLPLSFLIPLSTTAGHKMSHANGWKSSEATSYHCPFPNLGVTCVLPSLPGTSAQDTCTITTSALLLANYCLCQGAE